MTESFALALPEWTQPLCARFCGASDEEKMGFALALAEENIERGGGPFAAAVFDLATGRLVSVGVNMVVQAKTSLAHAEIVAILLAQSRLLAYDLSCVGAFELVSTAEPCAMCMGAIPWAGFKRLVCGARGSDVRAIGFDEGRKPPGWVRYFESRGIAVARDVLRARARDALRAYQALGGVLYNGAEAARRG